VNARLKKPESLAFTVAENLLVADRNDARIPLVNMTTGVITTAVNAQGTPGNSGDGLPATEAQVAAPTALSVDLSTGAFYFADAAYPAVRRVASDGRISTIAGTGAPGFSGDGYAPAAQLGSVASTAVSSSGTIYLAQPSSDDGAPRSYIRKMTWRSFSPCPQ